jgi:hypothetical protein
LHNKDKGPATDQQLVAGFSTWTLAFNTTNPFGRLSVYMTGVFRPLQFPLSVLFHYCSTLIYSSIANVTESQQLTIFLNITYKGKMTKIWQK